MLSAVLRWTSSGSPKRLSPGNGEREVVGGRRVGPIMPCMPRPTGWVTTCRRAAGMGVVGPSGSRARVRARERMGPAGPARPAVLL